MTPQIREAIAAYGPPLNFDPGHDLFTVMRVLMRITQEWTLDEIGQLLDRLEADGRPLDRMTVAELLDHTVYVPQHQAEVTL